MTVQQGIVQIMWKDPGTFLDLRSLQGARFMDL